MAIRFWSKFSQGFSLVELIMALGIFLILAAGVGNVAVRSYRYYYGTADKQAVAQFAQEGLEGARAIADYSWTTFKNGVGSNHGVRKNTSTGIWEYNGTSDTRGALTRVVTVANVSRDTNGNVVSSGGSNDPLTKKVTVTISGSGMTNYVLTGYIADTGHRIWEQTSWTATTPETYWHDLTRTSIPSTALSSNYTVNGFTTSTAGKLIIAGASAASMYSSIYMMGSAAKELRAVTVEQSSIAANCTLEITLETSNVDSFASPVTQVISDTSATKYTSSTSDTLNGKLYMRYKVDMSGCTPPNTTLYSLKIKYR